MPLGAKYGSGLPTNGNTRGFSVASSWFEQHKHFFLNFFTVDENLSWHLQYNIDTFTTNPSSVNVSDAAFMGSNRKFSQYT
jgi:hypothetical protein